MAVTIRRLNFKTSFTVDYLGFINHLGLGYDQVHDSIIIGKGSLVYGLWHPGTNNTPHGYIFDDDMEVFIPETSRTDFNYHVLLLTIDYTGQIKLLERPKTAIIAPDFSVADRPYWHTVSNNNDLLIGKIVKWRNIPVMMVTCDDFYFCDWWPA